MDNNYQLTQLTPKDFREKDWQAIETIYASSHYDSPFDQRYLSGGIFQATTREEMLEYHSLPGAIFLAAKHHDDMVGFMEFYTEGHYPKADFTRGMSQHEHLGPLAYSDMLIVHKEHQHQGVSTALRRTACEICLNKGFVAMYTLVRLMPLPNLASMQALRKTGGIFTGNNNPLKRRFPGIEDELAVDCLEALYPTDPNHLLAIDKSGRVSLK